MTGTCEDCGGDVETKTKGTYLDWCEDCLSEYQVPDDHKPSANNCAECGNPAVGRPEGEWVCAACWTGIA